MYNVPVKLKPQIVFRIHPFHVNHQLHILFPRFFAVLLYNSVLYIEPLFLSLPLIQLKFVHSTSSYILAKKEAEKYYIPPLSRPDFFNIFTMLLFGEMLSKQTVIDKWVNMENNL